MQKKKENKVLHKESDTYIIIEYMPWFESKRIVFSSKCKEEAEKEFDRLSSKTLDSSYELLDLQLRFTNE